MGTFAELDSTRQKSRSLTSALGQERSSGSHWNDLGGTGRTLVHMYIYKYKTFFLLGMHLLPQENEFTKCNYHEFLI